MFYFSRCESCLQGFILAVLRALAPLGQSKPSDWRGFTRSTLLTLCLLVTVWLPVFADDASKAAAVARAAKVQANSATAEAAKVNAPANVALEASRSAVAASAEAKVHATTASNTADTAAKNAASAAEAATEAKRHADAAQKAADAHDCAQANAEAAKAAEAYKAAKAAYKAVYATKDEAADEAAKAPASANTAKDAAKSAAAAAKSASAAANAATRFADAAAAAFAAAFGQSMTMSDVGKATSDGNIASSEATRTYEQDTSGYVQDANTAASEAREEAGNAREAAAVAAREARAAAGAVKAAGAAVAKSALALRDAIRAANRAQTAAEAAAKAAASCVPPQGAGSMTTVEHVSNIQGNNPFNAQNPLAGSTPATTVPSGCTAPQPRPETRTNSCPAGQTGSIIQTRMYSCIGTTWAPGDYVTTSNTCTSIPPSCTAPQPSPETQTSSCPTGQTGSIIQTRTYSCVGTTWTPGPYIPASNTCVTPAPPPTGCATNFSTGSYLCVGQCGIASTGLGVISGSNSMTANPFGTNGNVAFICSGPSATSSNNLVILGFPGHTCNVSSLGTSAFGISCRNNGGGSCTGSCSK